MCMTLEIGFLCVFFFCCCSLLSFPPPCHIQFALEFHDNNKQGQMLYVIPAMFVQYIEQMPFRSFQNSTHTRCYRCYRCMANYCILWADFLGFLHLSHFGWLFYLYVCMCGYTENTASDVRANIYANLTGTRVTLDRRYTLKFNVYERLHGHEMLLRQNETKNCTYVGKETKHLLPQTVFSCRERSFEMWSSAY